MNSESRMQVSAVLYPSTFFLWERFYGYINFFPALTVYENIVDF